MGFFVGHGHGGGASDDAAAAADMMEQGCVRHRPQPVLGVNTGERAAEERRRPKKLSSSSGHSRGPTMKPGTAFFTGLLIVLLLVYFATATWLPLSKAMRISFLFVASGPLVVTLVTHVLLHRAD